MASELGLLTLELPYRQGEALLLLMNLRNFSHRCCLGSFNRCDPVFMLLVFWTSATEWAVTVASEKEEKAGFFKRLQALNVGLIDFAQLSKSTPIDCNFMQPSSNRE